MNPATVNDLSMVKEIVEIIFYLVTGTAVVVGLNSWRNELKGRARYEAAKSIIAGAYRVRDAINSARVPIMFPAEWADRKQEPNESDEEKLALNNFHGYARRYERINDAVSQWYPAIVEAEALCGQIARKNIDNLRLSVQKLRIAIEFYHRDQLEVAKSHIIKKEQEPDQFNQQCFNVIFNIHPGMSKTETGKSQFDDDGFQAHLDSAIKGIEEYFSVFIK